jgi:hypothetical protein
MAAGPYVQVSAVRQFYSYLYLYLLRMASFFTKEYYNNRDITIV